MLKNAERVWPTSHRREKEPVPDWPCADADAVPLMTTPERFREIVVVHRISLPALLIASMRPSAGPAIISRVNGAPRLW